MMAAVQAWWCESDLDVRDRTAPNSPGSSEGEAEAPDCRDVQAGEQEIPPEEVTRLLLCLTDALELAAQGEPGRGHLKLLGGLVRAASLRKENAAGAERLYAYWEKALATYRAQYPQVAGSED